MIQTISSGAQISPFSVSNKEKVRTKIFTDSNCCSRMLDIFQQQMNVPDSITFLPMTAFKKLSQSEQEQVSGYIDLVQRWVDINDEDSKNSLREATSKISKHLISKTFPPMQELTKSVSAYVNAADSEAKTYSTNR